MVKVNSSESGDMGDHSRPGEQGAETLCHPSAILRGTDSTEPVSALTRALLHCCTLYLESDRASV